VARAVMVVVAAATVATVVTKAAATAANPVAVATTVAAVDHQMAGRTCRWRRSYRRSCARMPSRLPQGCTHYSSRRPTPRHKQAPEVSRSPRRCLHCRAP
jgi:hypothetical protein